MIEIHLVSPVCRFSSADHKMPNEPFIVGARVRRVGYPISGAGAVVGIHDGIVRIKFDEGEPPRPDFAVLYGNDGSVGVNSIYLELLFP